MVRRLTTTAKMLVIFRYWAEPFASTSSFNLPHSLPGGSAFHTWGNYCSRRLNHLFKVIQWVRAEPGLESSLAWIQTLCSSQWTLIPSGSWDLFLHLIPTALCIWPQSQLHCLCPCSVYVLLEDRISISLILCLLSIHSIPPATGTVVYIVDNHQCYLNECINEQIPFFLYAPTPSTNHNP